jgi:hypothetical protein
MICLYFLLRVVRGFFAYFKKHPKERFLARSLQEMKGRSFWVSIGLLINNTSTNNGIPGRLRNAQPGNLPEMWKDQMFFMELSGQKETVCR